MSQLLNEMTVARPKIVESNKAKLPEGVLLRVSYPICNIDERNHNNRIYRKSVWEKVMNDTDIREKMERRCLFGHAEHPETTQSNLEKTSHIITKMWIDEGINKVYQQFDVLDTPYGRIIETLFRAGCQVGCSTRAEGDLKEAEDDKGKYMEVIAESYAYVTTDYTADPSTYKSIPEDVEMNMVETIEKGFGEKKMDKDYAVRMLEGMKSQKAVALLETIKKEVKEEQVEVGADGKVEVEAGAGVPGDPAYKVEVEGGETKVSTPGADVIVKDGETEVITTPAAEPEAEPAVEVPPVEDPVPEVPHTPGKPNGVPGDEEPKEEEPEIEVEGELDMEDLPFENKKEKKGKIVFENYQSMVKFLEQAFAKVNGKLSKDLKLSVLEGMKSETAKTLLESIKVDEAQVEADQAGNVEAYVTLNPERDYVYHGATDRGGYNLSYWREYYDNVSFVIELWSVTPEVADALEKHGTSEQVASDGYKMYAMLQKGGKKIKDVNEYEGFDEDLPFENKKEKKGKIVFENYQSMVKFLEQAFAKVNGKLSKDLKLSEGIEPSETKKQITDLNISLAETKAESEKASDLLKETSEKLTKLEERSKKDAEALTEAKKQLTEKDEKIATLEGKNKKIEEKLSVLTPQIVKVEEANKDFDAKIKAMKEAHQKELIHKYVHTRIESTGLHVSPGTLTLLENCQTEGEADKLFTDIMRNITESTLHSSDFGKPSDQNKESKVVRTPEDDAIRNRVQENFRAMNKGF